MTAAHDDDFIADDLPLYRRIPDVWIVEDKNRGCMRISSGAFGGAEMSIVLDDTLRASGRSPASPGR